MPRRYLALLLLLACQLPLPAHAWENEAYNACILQYQKEARTDYAARLIRTACDRLHRHDGPLFSDDKRYHECVLAHIPGMESDVAIENVRRTCKQQSE